MQQFTEEELRKYNGQDGAPAYIAFKGKVYDVSSSKLWKNGTHFKRHMAGADLTPELEDAPHAEEVFEQFEPVGLFILPLKKSSPDEKEARKERYRQWYAIYHPHPAVVHFPIALHYFSGFTDVLFLANPSSEYEAAVFLSFLIATVMGFVALIAGVFSWWINYDFAMSKGFVIKLIGALFTLIIGMVPLTQKLMDPNVPFSHGMDGWIYHGIIFITVISVTIVGYYGGKITWGARQ
jgi:predicted heme/steroid binding protein/uncharacterized membrane protein